MPLALAKQGPTKQLVFLGIGLDTAKLELHLPDEKLRRLVDIISSWQARRSCPKREFLYLIGHLQHATRIVKPGRPFLRRMIDLSMSARELHHHIRLRTGFHSDLQWWALFLRRWNGIRMMTLGRNTPETTVTSDASGTWGCGAFSDSGQ